jgi:hypothetical protein
VRQEKWLVASGERLVIGQIFSVLGIDLRISSTR